MILIQGDPDEETWLCHDRSVPHKTTPTTFQKLLTVCREVAKSQMMYKEEISQFMHWKWNKIVTKLFFSHSFSLH